MTEDIKNAVQGGIVRLSVINYVVTTLEAAATLIQAGGSQEQDQAILARAHLMLSKNWDFVHTQLQKADPEAVELIPDFKPLPTGDALREHWLSKLGGAPRHFFAYLLKRYPEFSTREEIAEATNYRITSSTFGNALTSLRAPDLIEENQSRVRANPTLFET